MKNNQNTNRHNTKKAINQNSLKHSKVLYYLCLIIALINFVIYLFNIMSWLSLTIFIVAFVLSRIIYKYNIWAICPKCKTQFKPKKLFILGIFKRKKFLCPYCRKTYKCKKTFNLLVKNKQYNQQ